MRHPRIAIKTPENLDQAAELISRVQEIDQEIEKVRVEISKENHRYSQELWDRTLPLVHERDEIVRAVESFASSHRSELTIKKKSVDVPCGRFGWRDGSVCVEVANESH